MKIMSEGLEHAAGNKMQQLIERLTGKTINGVLVGAAVTALIQSSSATTVMVVGFVNVGIMSIYQAIGVIMGANIGTTVTAQIIRLADISNDNLILMMLKPKNFAPIALAVGVTINIICKQRKLKSIGEVAVGFGLLFIGLNNMEGAVSSLSELPQFRQMFASFSNPVVGILTGAAVTAIIQSSSGSIGILQAVSTSGMLTISHAAPIILGQNIGTCVTAIISSVGANKNAKKAALVHLIFNVTGTVIVFTVIYALLNNLALPMWDNYWNSQANRGSIADFHTLFNVLVTLVLLPCTRLIQKAVDALLPGNVEKTDNKLDPRFLTAPNIAVAQAKKCTLDICTASIENIALLKDYLGSGNPKIYKQIRENEDYINNWESQIRIYLGNILENPITIKEDRLIMMLFQAVADIERINDHIMNIAKIYDKADEADKSFSQSAQDELDTMQDAVADIMKLSYDAIANDNVQSAYAIEPLEQVIDRLNYKYRGKHIDRLSAKKCTVQSGIIFLDIVANLSRISDHCSNIGIAVLQNAGITETSNPHEYARLIHTEMPGEYKRNYDAYARKYGAE